MLRHINYGVHTITSLLITLHMNHSVFDSLKQKHPLANCPVISLSKYQKFGDFCKMLRKFQNLIGLL
jgi:hypothetical protein